MGPTFQRFYAVLCTCHTNLGGRLRMGEGAGGRAGGYYYIVRTVPAPGRARMMVVDGERSAVDCTSATPIFKAPELQFVAATA